MEILVNSEISQRLSCTQKHTHTHTSVNMVSASVASTSTADACTVGTVHWLLGAGKHINGPAFECCKKKKLPRFLYKEA